MRYDPRDVAIGIKMSSLQSEEHHFLEFVVEFFFHDNELVEVESIRTLSVIRQRGYSPSQLSRSLAHLHSILYLGILSQEVKYLNA